MGLGVGFGISFIALEIIDLEAASLLPKTFRIDKLTP